MVLSAKWSKSNGGDHWGTSILLVLFPEEDQDSKSNKNNNANNSPSTTSSLYHNITRKKNKKPSISSLISLSPSSLSSSSTSSFFSGKRLISKAQSTLSICGLLVFTTFLLFTLSTFEPNTAAAISRRSSSSSHLNHRRILLQRSNPSPPPLPFRISNYFFRRRKTQPQSTVAPPPALQGMGRLYRRGTRAMSDLVVAHVSDSDDGETSLMRLRSFLRIVHNAGVLSRSDLIFLFSSPSASDRLSRAISDENGSFLRLLILSSSSAAAAESNRTNTDLPPGLRRYFGRTGAGHKDAIWGKGTGAPAWVARSENGNGTGTEHDDPTRPSYGSVVGFDAMELDPENSLSGFVDGDGKGVTMGLRRWACYPMLLGRVRRKYKHMALVSVDDVVVLNDPLSRVRNRSPESVFLWTTTTTTTTTNTNTHAETEDTAETGKQRSKKGGSHHHHNHNHNHNHHHHRHGDDQKPPPVSPGIVVGGTRGVRRLSDAVLTEIVRASMDQHPHGSRGGKSKEKGANSGSAAVSEAGIVNQLVRGDRGMLSKKVELVVDDGGEPIPDAMELAAAIGSKTTGWDWAGRSSGWGGHVPVSVSVSAAQWGRSNNRDDSLGLGVGSYGGISGVIIKGLCCLSELQSAVYRDCLSAQL